jgi:cytosine/creatinine deaminase
MSHPDYDELLRIAIEEAEIGLSEGGIPIGAALFSASGEILGRGHNRRVQHGDPSAHGETDAFRNAGRQARYDDKILATTLAPCWYCSGLIRQFRIGTVIVGDATTFAGGIDWLRECGTTIVVRQSERCVQLMEEFIRANPELWNEDIGVPT